MHIPLPLYIYPSTFPASSASHPWYPLFSSLSSHPTTTHTIINPHNGPGVYPPDSAYTSSVSNLHSHPNAKLYGYIHTSYGTRTLSSIYADIDTWELWNAYPSNANLVGAVAANSNISIGGLFVDETPADQGSLAYVTAICTYARTHLTRGAEVWLNTGVPVDPSFYAVADLINAYENTWDAWQNGGGKDTIPAAVRAQSTVMLHGYPVGASSQLQTDVKGLVAGGYAAALVTEDVDYFRFSDNWGDYVAQVDTSQTS